MFVHVKDSLCSILSHKIPPAKLNSSHEENALVNNYMLSLKASTYPHTVFMKHLDSSHVSLEKYHNQYKSWCRPYVQESISPILHPLKHLQYFKIALTFLKQIFGRSFNFPQNINLHFIYLLRLLLPEHRQNLLADQKPKPALNKNERGVNKV